MGSLRYRHLKLPLNDEFVSLVHHGANRSNLQYCLGPIQETLAYIASVLFPEFNPNDHPMYWRSLHSEMSLSSQGLKVTLKGEVLSNGSLGILGHPVQLSTTVYDPDILILLDRAFKEYSNDNRHYNQPQSPPKGPFIA